MTRIYFRPELWDLSQAFKVSRKELGYTQTTMAKILGYNGKNGKKTIRHFEGARREIPQDKLVKMHKFITEGMPPGSPKPDLKDAAEKYSRLLEIEKQWIPPAPLKPGQIIIRSKKELSHE